MEKEREEQQKAVDRIDNCLEETRLLIGRSLRLKDRAILILIALNALKESAKLVFANSIFTGASFMNA
jgi:hypothetical protein